MAQRLLARPAHSWLCRIGRRGLAQQPAVGVAAIVLNKASADRTNPSVLMIQRGKEPKKGQWSFPGGRLELGETLADCARREVLEETQVDIDVRDQVVTAIDVITRNAHGAIDYHYVVVDLLAFGANVEPSAGDDALAVQWIRMKDVTTAVPCHDGIQDALHKLEAQLETVVWPVE